MIFSGDIVILTVMLVITVSRKATVDPGTALNREETADWPTKVGRFFLIDILGTHTPVDCVTFTCKSYGIVQKCLRRACCGSIVDLCEAIIVSENF